MRRVKRRSACSALLVQNVIQDITQTCILKVVVFTNWQRLGVWKLLSSVCHSFERQDFLSAMFDVVRGYPQQCRHGVGRLCYHFLADSEMPCTLAPCEPGERCVRFRRDNSFRDIYRCD